MNPGDWRLDGVTLANPHALWALAAVAAVFVWSLVGVNAPRKLIAPVVRAIVLALFVLALAAPERVTHVQGATRPAVIDASASITPAMRAWTAKLLSGDLGMRATDPAVIFAANSESTTVGDAAATLASAGGCGQCAPGATDLEAALERVAAYSSARNGPVVLVTDGWQNRGDAMRAVGALRSAGVELEIFTPPAGGEFPNVAITDLALPPALAKAGPFALSVTAANYNSSPVSGTISILEDGRPIETRGVVLPSGQQRFDFPVHAEGAGLTSYTASFRPANPAQDIYPEDNSRTAWVGVGAQRKVLVLSGSARDAGYLDTVIRRMGLEPTVETVASGDWSGSVKGYDAILLSDIARARLSPAAQSALAAYAEEGGSLAMVGGDQSFGLGGYGAGPIARVMPVLMKPPQHHEQTRALVLIIDKSGSMGRNNKLNYAKAAALTVTKTLRDSDYISVIGFDSQPFVVVPLAELSETRPYFDQMIGRLKAQGTTFLLPALEEAGRTLAQSGASIKHVVILTDGETGGTAAMYYDLVSAMHREAGATISTIAIGREANVALLQAISQYGGGSFYQTDSPANLPEVFLQDVAAHGGEATMVEKQFVPYTVRPDAVLKDLAGRRLPAIKGYVATELRPGATLDAYVESGGRHDPLIASWSAGAGKTIAVTTDASGRWSSPWMGGDLFGELWSRILSWMTPQTPSGPSFDVALGYREGRIHIGLTDYSEHPAASGVVTATVIRPDGSRIVTTLSEEVPGELYGSFDAPHPGTYNITLRTAAGGNITFPRLAYTVSPAVNAEVPRSSPNYALLEQLASATGGRLNLPASQVGLSRAEHQERQTMAFPLILAAMLLLIGEALIRRLTW